MKKLAVMLALAATATGALADTNAAALFHTRCAKCHGDQGEGNPKALETVCEGVDPAKLTLSGIGRRTDDDIRKRILDGAPDMPAYREKLTSEQVDAIIAHLRTLFPAAASRP